VRDAGWTWRRTADGGLVARRAGGGCAYWSHGARYGGLSRTQTSIGKGGVARGGAGVRSGAGEAAARWGHARRARSAAHSVVHVTAHDARYGVFVSSRFGALRACGLIIPFHRRPARGRRALGSGRRPALGQPGAGGRGAVFDRADASATSQSGGAGRGDTAAFADQRTLGAQCCDRHALADRSGGEWCASV